MLIKYQEVLNIMDFKKSISTAVVLIITGILLSGCAGLNSSAKIGDIPKTQYQPKDLNAEIIEIAAREAATQIVTVPLIKLDKKYVVMSMENSEKTDQPLNALIEDAIISAMTKGGFAVYERDKDILIRLAYQEGADKMKSFTLPPSESAEKIKAELPKYDVDYGKKIQITPARVNQDLGSDNLETADYVIGYRIIEAGVKYYKTLDKDEAGATQIKRSALVKLAIRITEAKTGKIVWGDTLSGISEDLAPRQQIKYLEKTGYEFYQFTMPLQNGK